MRPQKIRLNLIPGGIEPVVHVSQYDAGRVIEFALYDGITTANIESGTVIDVRGTKPDKKGFSYPCEYAGNIITINTTRQMTAVDGSFDCELHLVKDTQEIGTANFILEVEPAALSDDTVISDSEIPAIIEAARKNTLTDESVQTLVDSASAAAISATDAASSASAAASSAENAANSASAANTSKTAAANSASSAAQSAEAASSYNRYAYEYSTSAEHSAQSAAASAQQALENATGVKEFSGSDPGLVPRSTKAGAFLRSDGEWADDVATDADMNALRTSLQTSFQDGVDAIYNAITAQGVTPSASTPSACATGISTVATNKYNAGKAEGKTEAEAVTWESDELQLDIGFASNGQINAYYDAKNIKSIKCISASTSKKPQLRFNDSAKTIITMETNGVYTVPSGVTRIQFWVFGSTVEAMLKFKITYQAKILR